ncbi:MAG: response regulator transcription factor [bacterium]
MKKNRVNIAVIGLSDIIYEGLSNILYRHGDRFTLYRTDSIDEIDILMVKIEINIAILNPESIINREKHFAKTRKQYKGVFWLALAYSFINTAILNEFDDSIYITDPDDIIFRKIDRFYKSRKKETRDELSSRERDVLVHLVQGLSSKEIADTLNISIHTVISHRKNISEKTGIRSLPGLTIYAISNNLIPFTKE